MIVVPYAVKGGYLQVDLHWHGVRSAVQVHVAVATAFLGDKPGDDYQVHHLDRNRQHNAVHNLQWLSPKDHQEIHNAGGL